MRRERILVVDDNRDAAQGLAMLLEIKGHHVETAFDGPEALDRAEELQPTVVLLDIGLPAMDGYQVARELRRRQGGRQMLLVAVTGYGHESDRQRSRDAGFDHHLLKPVGIDALEEVLDGKS
jgi:CheY-like chemotaxis protein